MLILIVIACAFTINSGGSIVVGQSVTYDLVLQTNDVFPLKGTIVIQFPNLNSGSTTQIYPIASSSITTQTSGISTVNCLNKPQS